jgi:hypothetical protein
MSKASSPKKTKLTPSGKNQGKSARPENTLETACSKQSLKRGKIDTALEYISDGISVLRACELAGIKRTTFLKYVDGDKYARARDSQADVHFADMAALEDDCLAGRIDYNAFRAAMDARKWRLARMRPTVYGDKQAVEHTGDIVISWGQTDKGNE